MKRLEYLF